jgi:hypothetical protein
MVSWLARILFRNSMLSEHALKLQWLLPTEFHQTTPQSNTITNFWKVGTDAIMEPTLKAALLSVVQRDVHLHLQTDTSRLSTGGSNVIAMLVTFVVPSHVQPHVFCSSGALLHPRNWAKDAAEAAVKLIESIPRSSHDIQSGLAEEDNEDMSSLSRLLVEELLANGSDNLSVSQLVAKGIHFTSLQFTSLHFTSLHFTSLHFTSLHFTSLHFLLINEISTHSQHQQGRFNVGEIVDMLEQDGVRMSLTLGLQELRYGKSAYLQAESILEMLSKYSIEPDCLSTLTGDNESSVTMVARLLGLPKICDIPHILNLIMKALSDSALRSLCSYLYQGEGEPVMQFTTLLTKVTLILRRSTQLMREWATSSHHPMESEDWKTISKAQSHRFLNITLRCSQVFRRLKLLKHRVFQDRIQLLVKEERKESGQSSVL